MSKRLLSPFRVAAIYAVFGAAWILFSDAILHALVQDAELVRQLQTVKGGLFILVTGALVFWLARRMLRGVEAEAGERERTEREYRASERRYQVLFENAEVAILNEDLSAVRTTLTELRLDGVRDLRAYLEKRQRVVWKIFSQVEITAVNAATLRLFEASSAEEFPHRIGETVSLDALGPFIDILCAIWEGEKSVRTEIPLRSLAGNDIHAIVSFRIPETDEGFRSVPVSITDITERKQVESVLRRAQRMEAVGQMTGGLAHDLNNVLGIISINVGLLETVSADDPRVETHVDAAMQGIRRASEFTRKLLDFSRTEPAQTKRVEVNDFLNGMHNLIAKSLTPAIRLHMDMPDTAWAIDVDPGDFEAAILNLALNARDAMPDGGSLVIETSNNVVDLSYVSRNPGSTPGEFVVISISDTGTGMTPETQERAFEPFFTTKSLGKGTGLGLSMVYGFVQRSGGHVKISSKPGRGTAVRLYLPRAQRSRSDDRDHPAESDVPQGRGETVLVVDDEPELVEAAVTSLETLGYRTVAASGGARALEILDSDPSIDLLFSDVIMPEMDGYQLAIAAGERRPDLRILLTSGFTRRRERYADGDPEFAAELTRALLQKPYSIPELALAVRAALDSLV